MSKMYDIDKERFQVKHHFAAGVYAKEMVFTPEYDFKQHAHKYDHMSILAKGSALVEVNGIHTHYKAPAVIEIKKELSHTVIALEPCVWYCIHPTDLTDPDEIDESFSTRVVA